VLCHTVWKVFSSPSFSVVYKGSHGQLCASIFAWTWCHACSCKVVTHIYMVSQGERITNVPSPCTYMKYHNYWQLTEKVVSQITTITVLGRDQDFTINAYLASNPPRGCSTTLIVKLVMCSAQAYSVFALWFVLIIVNANWRAINGVGLGTRLGRQVDV